LISRNLDIYSMKFMRGYIVDAEWLGLSKSQTGEYQISHWQ